MSLNKAPLYTDEIAEADRLYALEQNFEELLHWFQNDWLRARDQFGAMELLLGTQREWKEPGPIIDRLMKNIESRDPNAPNLSERLRETCDNPDTNE